MEHDEHRPLTARELRRATEYNRLRGLDEAVIRRVQADMGVATDGLIGPITTEAIWRWQRDHGMEDVDGRLGPTTLGTMMQAWAETRPFDADERDAIVAHTIEHEAAGAANPYSAINADAEYEGWFDKPSRDEQGRRLKPSERAQRPDHKPFWASHYGGNATHIGVSLGPWQAAQDPGTVGLVLTRWHEIAPDEMVEVCGGERVVADLLRVTTAQGERELRVSGDSGRRRPCVMPVDGADLWEGPWPARWRQAAELPGYQRAHREVIAEGYLEPAWRLAQDLDWRTQQDVAVLFDLAIQMGPAWVRKHARAVHGQGARDVRALLGLLSREHRARRREIMSSTAPWITYAKE